MSSKAPVDAGAFLFCGWFAFVTLASTAVASYAGLTRVSIFQKRWIAGSRRGAPARQWRRVVCTGLSRSPPKM